MELKNYTVALKSGVDYDQFWKDLENETSNLPHVPNRAVKITDNLDAFKRICTYALTDLEASTLRKDPRVLGVDIPVQHRTDIVVRPHTIQFGNYTKPTATQTAESSSGNNINWGLIRQSNPTNVYGSGLTTEINYDYVLDGSGIDVVITDSGVQADHPEFQYAGNSTSRVQQIDWSTFVPALSTMGNAYQDPDGHGTHVCGIVAGKTYGWAKNAQIYSLVATGDQSADPLDIFQAVKTWHESKGSNGNPTVMNMSWGIVYPYTYFGADVFEATNNLLGNISSVTYRGTTYSGNASVTNYGILLDTGNIDCLSSLINGLPARVSSYDVALEELIESGVVVCRAAGNSSYKIDVPGGTDYENYASFNNVLGDYYYQQGDSPISANVINVGSLDATTYSNTLDQKATYSCAGPGVDVYAAGTNILSSYTSNLASPSYSGSSVYFLNNNFRQYNDTGTSMASPQVVGIISLYLQTNPPANIQSSMIGAQVKSWVSAVATPTINRPGNSSSYLNFYSLLGGNAAVAFQPFSAPNLQAVEVYVGGERTVTGFNITNISPVTIQFDTPPPSGVEVTILVRQGETWYAPGAGTPSNGVPLQDTDTSAARFLRGL